MTKPTFGSLFAGVGGIDLGFEAAGWEGKFQVEWDAHCQQTLAYHWPDVPRWGDVSDVNGADLPPVDLITFGSPCQDLSTAGKRAGLVEGSRSNLFFQATRIIKEMRDASGNTFPRWALWENVPGAFSSNQGADFGAVLDEMADLGAVAIEWHCLDAQFFGVPQRRRRVFVLACFDLGITKRGRQQVLPVPEGRRGDSATRRKARQDASRASQDRATGASRQDAKGWDSRGTGIIGALNAVDYKWVQNQQIDDNKLILEVSPETESPEPSVYVKGRRAHSADDYETWDRQEVAPTLNQGDNVSETRSTVLIIDGTRVDDVRIYEEPVQTMIGRWGTGGGNVPYLAIEAPLPVLMRQREGKAGGGKGPLLSTDLSPSLVGSNELVLFAPANETIYAFDTQFGSNATVMEDISPTLKATQASPSVGMSVPQEIAIPIQDGREIEKHQNGLGVGDIGEPMYTLDQTGGQAVAQEIVYPIQGTIVGRSETSGPQGLGVGDPGDPMYTLDLVSQHHVAQEVITLPISHAALRGGGVALTPSPNGQGGESLRDPGFGLGQDGDPMYSLTTTPPAVAHTERNEQMTDTPIPKLVVRRLTPIECERLMGWPDNHTLYRADGKENKDGARYKMCGNGVASPVAEWIARHILKAQEKIDEDRGEQ
jgi:DNA (cytosine-5)-methyltransferase 1